MQRLKNERVVRPAAEGQTERKKEIRKYMRQFGIGNILEISPPASSLSSSYTASFSCSKDRLVTNNSSHCY